MRFKIKIIITIMVSFVVIVSMCFFVSNRNSISISGFNSDTIITGSNNSYLITLKGVPSGNGTYQQLIIINNYSKYGINNNGSNIQFIVPSNSTTLYAWIESINTTTLQVWVKNYNGSGKIDLEVLAKSEDLFSATGYLGEAPQLSPTWNEYNNYKQVGMIYIPATTKNFSLSDRSVDCNSPFAINGYTQGWQSNNTVEWVNDTHNVAVGGWWFGPYLDYPSGSFNEIIILKLMGSNSSTYFDHFQNSYFITGITYTYKSISGNGNWQSYNLLGAINLTSSGEQFRGGIPDLGSFSQMYFAGIYLAYYSGSPFNNEQNPTITSMPTYTIVILYHNIDFKLLGSPFSSLWNIMVNGTTYQADSSNIYLNMTNGYYNIIVNLPAGYSAITKGVLYVNGTNQVYNIFVSYNNNSGISNDIIYAIILASIIVAVAIYFSKRS